MEQNKRPRSNHSSGHIRWANIALATAAMALVAAFFLLPFGVSNPAINLRPLPSTLPLNSADASLGPTVGEQLRRKSADPNALTGRRKRAKRKKPKRRIGATLPQQTLVPTKSSPAVADLTPEDGG